MKKILFLIFIFLIGLCAIVFYTFDGKDACLDSGVCKAGLKLKLEDGKEIIINKETCLSNNGEWREKFKDCYFKKH